MSGQQPGPVPETTPDVAAAPAPMSWPATGPAAAPHGTPQPYAGQPDGGQHDGGQPAQAAAPGWGAPGGGAPGWGAPPQDLAGPAQGWGAAGAPRRGSPTAKPWTLKRGLVVAGAAVVLAAGAGLGVYALTSSTAAADGTAAAGTTPAGPGGQGFAPGGTGGQGSAPDGFAGGGMPGQGGAGSLSPRGVDAGLAAAVHAEYVVLQGSAYVTKAEQLGTVTEISQGSVTVKSSDGFTRSYALGADVVVGRQQQRRTQGGGSTGSQLGVADIVAGASVRIVAVKNGADYAAESVVVAATAAVTGQTN